MYILCKRKSQDTFTSTSMYVMLVAILIQLATALMTHIGVADWKIYTLSIFQLQVLLPAEIHFTGMILLLFPWVKIYHEL